MFADYTRDRRSRGTLSQLCTKLHNLIVNGEDGQQRPAVAFGSVLHDWRSQKVAAGWIGTWAGAPKDDMGGRELSLLFETCDMIKLVAALADEVAYRGSWLFDVELDHLGGHMSQVNDPNSGFISGSGTTWVTRPTAGKS
jgi:hypothetical protein